MPIHSYKELTVWQRGIQLVKAVYKLTPLLPKNEAFGLVSQMQRAAVSIPANIAEGYARKHRAEYLQFLRIAFASGAELETYFALLVELDMVKPEQLVEAEELLDEVMRMLNKLISTLKEKS